MPVIRVVGPLLLPLCRAVNWTPLLVAGTVMPALAALVAAGTRGTAPGEALILLRASALLFGAAAAFTLTDDMAVNAAALPSPRWLRQWLRTLLALASASIGWMVTYLAATGWSVGSANVPLAGTAVEAVVGVTVGLAGAAFGVRRVPYRHGAVAGMATLFGAFVGSLFLPGNWSPWPLPGDPNWNTAHTGWLLATPVTMAALAIAHRDTRGTTVTVPRVPSPATSTRARGPGHSDAR
jgi:hypothetical protein